MGTLCYLLWLTFHLLQTVQLILSLAMVFASYYTIVVDRFAGCAVRSPTLGNWALINIVCLSTLLFQPMVFSRFASVFLCLLVMGASTKSINAKSNAFAGGFARVCYGLIYRPLCVLNLFVFFGTGAFAFGMMFLPLTLICYVVAISFTSILRCVVKLDASGLRQLVVQKNRGAPNFYTDKPGRLCSDAEGFHVAPA